MIHVAAWLYDNWGLVFRRTCVTHCCSL